MVKGTHRTMDLLDLLCTLISESRLNVKTITLVTNVINTDSSQLSHL